MYLEILEHTMGNKIERESSKPCKICGVLLKVNAESNSGILGFTWVHKSGYCTHDDLMHRLRHLIGRQATLSN